jgi:hypothetical protein
MTRKRDERVVALYVFTDAEAPREFAAGIHPRLLISELPFSIGTPRSPDDLMTLLSSGDRREA